MVTLPWCLLTVYNIAKNPKHINHIDHPTVTDILDLLTHHKCIFHYTIHISVTTSCTHNNYTMIN